MSIWTNKPGPASTAWTLDDEGNVTQTWDNYSGAGESIGTTDYAAGTIATYDSAAAAATSLLGSKYHLFDGTEFFFGTDKDVRMSFETTGEGMLIKLHPALTGDSTLMTFRNGSTDIMAYKSSGALELHEASSLPSSPKDGSIIFYDDNLYLAGD
jgi:hypothetical protein